LVELDLDRLGEIGARGARCVRCDREVAGAGLVARTAGEGEETQDEELSGHSPGAISTARASRSAHISHRNRNPPCELWLLAHVRRAAWTRFRRNYFPPPVACFTRWRSITRYSSGS